MVNIGGGADLPGKKKSDTTDTPIDGDVVTFNASKGLYDAQQPPGAGGGESNTASNVGTGEGVFKQKTGVDLELKSIIGGTGLTAVGNTNDVTLNVDHEFTAADETKLDGIATGATANDTDANLKARANHTGTQTASTISDYASATATFTNKTIDESGTGNSLKIRRGIQMVVFDFTTDVATGNGKFYFHIDSSLGGMDLVDVHAEVITAGTTGTTDIQVHNVTQAADMLSTVITIDSGETGSDTAATAAVIDTANDDVAQNDLIRIDVDAISTTAPQGLIVTLGFKTP